MYQKKQEKKSNKYTAEKEDGKIDEMNGEFVEI
jgi:hypothetical protein